MITYAQFYKDQKMKFLFTFLVERRPLLLANDIVINVPANVTLKIQYSRVIRQILDLD